MKIDDKVEQDVRAALDAAVHRDLARFQDSLRQFPDAESTLRALGLVFSVAAFVFIDVYGERLNPTQLTELAARIGRQEQWVEATDPEVRDVLRAMAQGDVSGVKTFKDRAAVLAIVVTANLLASASRPKEGEWWFNYLDKVEAAIEAAG